MTGRSIVQQPIWHSKITTALDHIVSTCGALEALERAQPELDALDEDIDAVQTTADNAAGSTGTGTTAPTEGLSPEDLATNKALYDEARLLLENSLSMDLSLCKEEWTCE